MKLEFSPEESSLFLPQEAPFLFIHEAKILLPGNANYKKSVVGANVHATYQFSNMHPILQGHFPNNPIVPGVIAIEMMAQASCFISSLWEEDPLKMRLKVLFLSVNNAKFRNPIYPDKQVEIISTCIQAREKILSFDAYIQIDQTKMAECSLKAQFDYDLV